MKKLILSLLTLIALAGCGNKTIFDTKYTFHTATCYLNREEVVYNIHKWKGYEGEQIQIITTDNRTLLLSMNYCMLEGN